jgi:hypothetical protein
VGWAIAALVLASMSAITAWQIGRAPASNPGQPSTSPPLPSPSTPVSPEAAAAPMPTPSNRASVPASSGHSAEKGVSTWDFTGVGAALRDVGAGWYCNWSAAPTAGAGTSAQFVPMIWGSGSVTTATLARAKATGLRLGSPAPASGPATPGGWLDQFLAGARERAYRVDFIALHWYGSDFATARELTERPSAPAATGQLRGYLRAVYDRYHLPIWLTEYALIKFGPTSTHPSGEQQAAFIRSSMHMLGSLAFVQRYAWFALPTSKAGDETGLYRDGSTPTMAGTAYRTTS